jgi:hypothetical protein
MADPLASMNAWGSPLPPQKDDLPPVPINDDEREGLGGSNGTMGPPHLQRDPRTYGVTGPTLIDASSNTAGPERIQPAAPFIRVRLGSIDRNKKDLLIRFDLSVSWMSSQLSHIGKLTIRFALIDKPSIVQSHAVPKYPTVVRRLWYIRRTNRPSQSPE